MEDLLFANVAVHLFHRARSCLSILVGALNPSETCLSQYGMIGPNIWKNIKMFQDHQPETLNLTVMY